MRRSRYRTTPAAVAVAELFARLRRRKITPASPGSAHLARAAELLAEARGASVRVPPRAVAMCARSAGVATISRPSKPTVFGVCAVDLRRLEAELRAQAEAARRDVPLDQWTAMLACLGRVALPASRLGAGLPARQHTPREDGVDAFAAAWDAAHTITPATGAGRGAAASTSAGDKEG